MALGAGTGAGGGGGSGVSQVTTPSVAPLSGLPTNAGVMGPGAPKSGTNITLAGSGPDLGTVIDKLNKLTQIGDIKLPKVQAPQIPETPFPYFDLGQIKTGLYGGIEQATKGAAADAKSLFAQMGLSDSTMMGKRLQDINLSGEASKAQVEGQLYNMALQKAQMDQQRALAQAGFDFQAGTFNAENAYRAIQLDISSALQGTGLMMNAILADINLQLQVNSEMQQAMQAFIGATASL